MQRRLPSLKAQTSLESASACAISVTPTALEQVPKQRGRGFLFCRLFSYSGGVATGRFVKRQPLCQKAAALSSFLQLGIPLCVSRLSNRLLTRQSVQLGVKK